MLLTIWSFPLHIYVTLKHIKNMQGVIQHPKYRLLTMYQLQGCIREYWNECTWPRTQ